MVRASAYSYPDFDFAREQQLPRNTGNPVKGWFLTANINLRNNEARWRQIFNYFAQSEVENVNWAAGQFEVGANEGNLHLHLLIEFSKSISLTQLYGVKTKTGDRIFAKPTLDQVDIRSIRVDKMEVVHEYVQKEETYHDGRFSTKPLNDEKQNIPQREMWKVAVGYLKEWFMDKT